MCLFDSGTHAAGMFPPKVFVHMARRPPAPIGAIARWSGGARSFARHDDCWIPERSRLRRRYVRAIAVSRSLRHREAQGSRRIVAADGRRAGHLHDAARPILYGQAEAVQPSNRGNEA